MNFEEKTVSSEEIYDGKIIKVRKGKKSNFPTDVWQNA